MTGANKQNNQHERMKTGVCDETKRNADSESKKYTDNVVPLKSTSVIMLVLQI